MAPGDSYLVRLVYKGDNMQYDTAGNPRIFYDMCGYCDMDTGGNHRSWCPCYKPLNEPILASEMQVNMHFQQLVEQGLDDIGQGRAKKIPNIKQVRGANP